MPTYKGKPRSSWNWLPNQVAYGVDCSDPEPKNWKPFGSLVDDQQAAASKQKPSAAVSTGLPAQ